MNPLRDASRLLAVGIALLLLGATAGCDGLAGQGDEATQYSDPVATKTLSEGGVNVEQIDRGQYGALVDGTQRVLRDESAYASFWETLHADRDSVPERPRVDFSEQVVVAVVLGQRPTGGYSVEIDTAQANEEGNQIQVQYTEFVPGDGCATTQVLTSPYVLATVAAQDESFTFEGTEKARSC